MNADSSEQRPLQDDAVAASSSGDPQQAAPAAAREPRRDTHAQPGAATPAVVLPRLSPLALLALAVAAVALAVAIALWQRLSNIQEQLARQSGDSMMHAAEARASAKGAQELARETAARLAVTDVRVSEVALQRSQLELSLIHI